MPGFSVGAEMLSKSGHDASHIRDYGAQVAVTEFCPEGCAERNTFAMPPDSGYDPASRDEYDTLVLTGQDVRGWHMANLLDERRHTQTTYVQFNTRNLRLISPL